jgi:CheY-like chemotaxis protein
VHDADNGQDGVLLALALQPDVVCLNLNLPVLSGYEAARIITRRVRSRRTAGRS